MNSSEPAKWTCECCTYENWPSNARCTMCCAARASQDIYKLATTAEGRQSPSDDVGGKWQCSTCSNWSRTKKCVQCFAPRHQPQAGLQQQQPQQQSQQQRTSSPLHQGNHSNSSSRSSSRRNSPRLSPEQTKDLHNERNLASKLLTKWQCRGCTYENWPKAVKCVMCHNPRVQEEAIFTIPTYLTPSPPQYSLVDSTRLNNAKNVAHIRNRSSSRSPPLIERISLTDSDQGRPSSGSDLSANIYPNSEAPPARENPPSNSNQVNSGYQLPKSSGCRTSKHEQKEEVNRIKQLTARLRNGLVTSLSSEHGSIATRMTELDWLFLAACHGVVDGNLRAVQSYLSAGGDPTRALTRDEVELLQRTSAFEAGHTLIHLALRFHREDHLSILLSSTDSPTRHCVKRIPSMASPETTTEIRRCLLQANLRRRKGDFQCLFLTECPTFALPSDIEDLPRWVQDQLFDEILDKEVQKELEMENSVINWSEEVTEQFGTRLYALWNRTAGDCLLDSVLQTLYGIVDQENVLRRTMADSLVEGATEFYPRWKEYERLHAAEMQYTLADYQWENDWSMILSSASQPGTSLEQAHIFVLAHVLRRPIIVYGVKYVKSFRGENIGFARFQGVYLPLLWEQSFCWKTPIALGYTRGHFSALVPTETDSSWSCGGAMSHNEDDDDRSVFYLPLLDSEGKLLDIHFLTGEELGHEESILREWLDCCFTPSGLLVARQRIDKRPALVSRMLDEWLSRYRNICSIGSSHPESQIISSDGETDEE